MDSAAEGVGLELTLFKLWSEWHRSLCALDLWDRDWAQGLSEERVC